MIKPKFLVGSSHRSWPFLRGFSNGSVATGMAGIPMGIRLGVTLGLGAASGAEGTGTALGRLNPSEGSRCRWNEGTLVQ